MKTTAFMNKKIYLFEPHLFYNSLVIKFSILLSLMLGACTNVIQPTSGAVSGSPILQETTQDVEPLVTPPTSTTSPTQTLKPTITPNLEATVTYASEELKTKCQIEVDQLLHGIELGETENLGAATVIKDKDKNIICIIEKGTVSISPFGYNLSEGMWRKWELESRSWSTSFLHLENDELKRLAQYTQDKIDKNEEGKHGFGQAYIMEDASEGIKVTPGLEEALWDRLIGALASPVYKPSANYWRTMGISLEHEIRTGEYGDFYYQYIANIDKLRKYLADGQGHPNGEPGWIPNEIKEYKFIPLFGYTMPIGKYGSGRFVESSVSDKFGGVRIDEIPIAVIGLHTYKNNPFLRAWLDYIEAAHRDVLVDGLIALTAGQGEVAAWGNMINPFTARLTFFVVNKAPMSDGDKRWIKNVELEERNGESNSDHVSKLVQIYLLDIFCRMGIDEDVNYGNPPQTGHWVPAKVAFWISQPDKVITRTSEEMKWFAPR